jgi:DNA mismatch repair protein MutL
MGYYTKIPKGRYPVAVLFLILDPREVDVNVHPRKAEVRFSRKKELEDAVTVAVEKVLSEHGLVPEIIENGRRAFQKTFKAVGSSGRLQVSSNQETSQKMIAETEIAKKYEVPESSSKIHRESTKAYAYPVKDTERKLKKSEHLLDFAGEREVQEALRENEQDGEIWEEMRIITEDDKQKPNTESLEDLRIIGQVSKMYILAEKGEDLVLIDQHAAHERILYEKVLKIKKSRVQELIIPITIDLTPKEKVLMDEYIPYLEEYGFGISEFGDNTYVVTFVPEVFGQLENPELIHDIVSDLLATGKVKKDTGISEKVCKILACRTAIKGGAAFNSIQMKELIEQLKKAENPYSCPHGRPTIIIFKKGELDRMFARTR